MADDKIQLTESFVLLGASKICSAQPNSLQYFNIYLSLQVQSLYRLT